jgi:hypothetical protein
MAHAAQDDGRANDERTQMRYLEGMNPQPANAGRGEIPNNSCAIPPSPTNPRVLVHSHEGRAESAPRPDRRRHVGDSADRVAEVQFLHRGPWALRRVGGRSERCHLTSLSGFSCPKHSSVRNVQGLSGATDGMQVGSQILAIAALSRGDAASLAAGAPIDILALTPSPASHLNSYVSEDDSVQKLTIARKPSVGASERPSGIARLNQMP